MAEASADSRRCLPAWMLKACSGNEGSKTEDQNKQALADKQPGALEQIKPVKRKSGSQIKTVDKDDAGEERVLRQCQGRENARRRSNDVDHPVEDEFEEIEKTISKNAKKVRGRTPLKNSKKRKLGNVSSEAAASGTTDDEIELTVEDLVSIAEEIVHADKEKQQKLQTTKTVPYREHHPRPPISTAVDTGESVVSSAQPMKGLTRRTTTTSTIETTPSECRVDKNNGHEELQRPPSIQITGDVAQDMLNIFLGPLLSKPTAYENKSEAIESMIMNAKHVPREEDLRREVERQGEPVTKKKSSWKDKVALFL